MNSPSTRVGNMRTLGSKQSRRRVQHEAISEEDAERPTHVAQHDLEARAADFNFHSLVGTFLGSGADESHTDSLERLQDITHAGVLLRDSSAKADIGDDHSYRLMEGAHRRPETTQKRYHVAFHPPVSSSLASQAVEVATRAPTLVSQRYQGDAQPPTVLSSPLVGNFDAEARGHDIWESVDDSINQLYEDPPIDLVKNTLFHANLSADGLSRTRRKQKQRERILAAAEELREVKTQQQVERDQAWRRKKQIQAMSETIRRRNKKFARSVDDTGAIDDAKSHPNGESSHNHPTVSITERKPAVPRLSGSRVRPSKRKHLKRRQGSDRSETEITRVELTTCASAAAGTGGNGVAASILLGDLSTSGSHEQLDTEDQESAPDMAAVPLTRDANTGDQSLLRRSNKHRVAPRGSASSGKKAHTSDENQDDSRNPRPSETLDHRRAIAREYMVLQQQQRMIRKSEVQQREAMEREKRRQQLELLEKRRLENLKHSRKRRSSRKQVPARRRGKARAKAPEATESSLIFAGNDQGSGEEMRRVSRSMSNDEQHQLSDAENDGTQGNIAVGYQRQDLFDLLKLPSSVAPASRNLLFGGVEVGPSLIVPHKEQPDAANPHIQKLLDLRRKAQELSQRLSGIRSAQKIPEKQSSGVKALSIEPDKPRDHVVDSGNHFIEQSIQISEREVDNRSQDSDTQSLAAKLDLLGPDSGVDGMNDEAEDSEDGDSDEEAISDGVEQDGDTDEDAKQESEEGEVANDESSVSSVTRLQYRDISHDASRYDMSSALVDMADGIDVDVRSIGVYNIAVVWPLAHDHPATDESGQRFAEITSSGSSPPSSQPDDSGSEYGGEFEQMRGDGVDDSASNRDSDSDMEMVARSPKIDERTRRTSEEWSAGKMAELLYSIDSMSKFSTSEQPRNDRIGFAMASWRLDMGSAPSDAFNQLVRAEDDSLSVIQRTALKLYERQEDLERLRRENEKQHQQEHDTLDSPNESLECDHEDDSSARQFARLDEIMQEVDRERSLESATNEMREISDDELNKSGDVDSDEASFDHSERITRARGHATASSEFWNQLICQSTIEESKYDEVEEEAQRSRGLSARATRHVEIDTSELVAQRMKQLRLADYGREDDDDGVDALDDLDQRTRRSRKRVHSPHSLAKRLLAEVEYHEAINDAHLKLTAMEQAQLLEQAQVETINIATAFKEEMEQNAVNHQLALDHVTLAKRFDDDLHDVVQQLHNIDEIEEQEHTARQIAAEIQLKQAQMRECSVQTEDPRVVDVGTSAPLHVDAGTSPIVPSVSTAVQYEFSGSHTSAGSSDSKLQVSIVEEEGDVYEDTVAKPLTADDSEAVDYGDEGFEQESGLHSRSYGVQGGVVVEDEEIHSEEESASSAAFHESEAESVVESATSLTGSNIVAGGSSGSREIEEVSDDDRVVVDSITHSEADGHVESATVDYEDDFNASSPTAMARSDASNGVDDDFEAESEYGDEAAGSRDDQSVGEVDEGDEDDEGGDEIEDDLAVRHNVVGGSGKDVSIEDDFEDEFALSVDNEVDGEEELQEDDSVRDDQIVEAHEVTKEELVPLLPDPLGRSAMAPPPASIDANMQYSGFYAGGFGYPQQFATSPSSLHSLPTADAGQSDQVIQAYMAELERRKQSETAMLCIRLQAAEAHFSHQSKRIDTAIADTKADAAAKAELSARKQRLMIAFMGEKANIDSLKAAATARYFQDMLSFQSLYANDLPSGAIADGTSLGLRDFPYIAAPTAQIYAPNVASQVKSLAAKTTSVGAESECYEDEFTSVTQDEAGNARSSIADSVEKSVVGEDGAYESEKQPCDVSVESEVEQVSQEQEGENADRLQSEADIESDVEEETRDKSMEEDDSKHPVEEGEVESDEYAHSEFEDETPDMPEEQAAAEEMAPQDEIDEFDDETEIAKSGEVASKVGDPEGEIETSEIHEDDDEHLGSEGQAETHSTMTDDIEDGGYDDDFASVSGSMQRQGSSHASNEDAVVEEEAQHDSGGADVVDEVESIPSVASSEQDHRISATRSEDEINEIPGGVVRESNASASAAAYSEDEFEGSEHVEASQPDSKPTLNVAESVAISTSDDSSTTKLLVTEVNAVQNTVAAGGDMTHATDAQSDKLMRKKAKVIELLEAKERLLHQQTRAFRLEEEKRMVNEAAHFALGLDISQELREAKANIVNELQSEFDALKATFPKLKKRLTTPLNTDKLATPAIGDEPALQSAPEVEQPVVIHAGAELRDNSNSNDYEIQSFEAASESGTANRIIGEEDEDLSDGASIADDASDRVQASVASEKYSEFGEDESTAAEDIRDDVNDAGADSVQSEVEEEQFESHGGGDEAVPSDGGVKSEDDGYENDYENESFADAQSAASVVDDDDDIVEQTQQSEQVTVEAETGEVVARFTSAVQSDAASEYTEDDFEQASESEAALSVHGDGFEDENEEEASAPSNTTSADHQGGESTVKGDAQSSVSDHELSAALATVESKLAVEGEGIQYHSEGLPCIEKSSELALDRADESTRELVVNALAPALESRPDGHSTSASSEEETLTKSIEERMARLEKLRTIILERQNDIRQVHKQLRIEKRKEVLTSEEKTLWAEVEGLEHELQSDVASLELIRQRNRLEFNQLEARQQRISANPLGFERDLLAGFDYIEDVDPCITKASLRRDADVQTPSVAEVECQTVAAPPFQEKLLVSTYVSDLLAGYDYVEHAQEVVAPAAVTEDPNDDGTVAEPIADLSIDDEESPVREQTAIKHSTEDYDALEEQDHSVDLLLGYALVEAVEPLCAVEADLLAGFDYTEDVEMAGKTQGPHALDGALVDHHLTEDIAAGESERSSENVDELSVPVSEGHHQCDDQERSPAAAASVDIAERNEFIDTTDAAEQPSSGEDEEGAFSDAVYEENASPPPLSTQQGLEVESVVDDGEETTRETSGEPDTTETGAMAVDTISSLILADLLQDMGSDAMLELNAWRKSRPGAQPSSSKAMPSDITRTKSIERSVTDPDYEEVNRDYLRSELDAASLQVSGTAVNTISTTAQSGYASDLAAKTDAATESIFSALFEDVLLSQLRAGVGRRTSRQQSEPMSLVEPKGLEVAASSSPTPSSSGTQLSHQARLQIENSNVVVKTASRQRFIDQTLSTLQVVDNCIRLGVFNSLECAGLTPDSARLLYDAIAEIGQVALDAHYTADLTVWSTISSISSRSDEELLRDLRQAVRRELEAAHATQTELHEAADRRLKAIADADDQMDDDDVALLRQFSARPLSTSSLISTAAPTWIARPPATLAASSASSSALTPRTPTPTSRGKSRARRSLLTLARSRQSAELQRRITSAVFDELLEDATGAVSVVPLALRLGP